MTIAAQDIIAEHTAEGWRHDLAPNEGKALADALTAAEARAEAAERAISDVRDKALEEAAQRVKGWGDPAHEARLVDAIRSLRSHGGGNG